MNWVLSCLVTVHVSDAVWAQQGKLRVAKLMLIDCR